MFLFFTHILNQWLIIFGLSAIRQGNRQKYGKHFIITNTDKIIYFYHVNYTEKYFLLEEKEKPTKNRNKKKLTKKLVVAQMAQQIHYHD